MSVANRQLGKYRVLEPIASGGMARIYRAVQPPLNRDVAIKLLRHVENNPDELSRLRREADALAAIRHPNVVHVLDYDVQDGRPYLVMELIDGASLQDILQNLRGLEPLPVQAIARIGVDVLLALEAIHQAGIIHRDLKPGNLLIDQAGKVVVADFGIALRMDDAQAVPARYRAGTAVFMAPELGVHGQASQASDLYAVGVLLFQLTTGQLPYSAATPDALIRAHAEQPVPDPEWLRRDLPPVLSAVIKRAMAKSVTDRFASARDMRLALEHALDQADIPLPTALELPEAAWIPPVVSGGDKEQLAQSSWANQDTFIDKPPKKRMGVGQSVFVALAVFVIGHGVVIATAGMLGRLIPVLSQIWPVEILWSALFFSLLQRALPKIFLVIIAAPLLAIGMLLSYFAATGNWHEWWWWLFATLGVASAVVAMTTRPNRERVTERSAAVQIVVASVLSLVLIISSFIAPAR